MGHKSDNPKVIVKSIEDGVREWANDDLVKVEIRSPVNPAVLLDLRQVARRSLEDYLQYPFAVTNRRKAHSFKESYICLPNVPGQVSPLAFGADPAPAGSVTKVPKAWGLTAPAR